MVDAGARDFLVLRRLVAFRPFVADDGVPGLQLRIDDGETIALRIAPALLELLHQAVGQLEANRPIRH